MESQKMLQVQLQPRRWEWWNSAKNRPSNKLTKMGMKLWLSSLNHLLFCLVLQQMCVFSILEAKTCVAGKPKTAAAAPVALPEEQAEPMAATSPVASPVAAPAPTVEVKEEAKPEDTELTKQFLRKNQNALGGDKILKPSRKEHQMCATPDQVRTPWTWWVRSIRLLLRKRWAIFWLKMRFAIFGGNVSRCWRKSQLDRDIAHSWAIDADFFDDGSGHLTSQAIRFAKESGQASRKAARKAAKKKMRPASQAARSRSSHETVVKG